MAIKRTVDATRRPERPMPNQEKPLRAAIVTQCRALNASGLNQGVAQLRRRDRRPEGAEAGRARRQEQGDAPESEAAVKVTPADRPVDDASSVVAAESDRGR